MEAPSKLIVVPYGTRKRLTMDFGVSYNTVQSALMYITKSNLANAIRACALQNGGYIATLQTDNKQLNN